MEIEVKLEDYFLVKEAKKLDDKLYGVFNDVANSYIQIGGYLNEMVQTKYYEVLDYKSIYEYAFDRFNLSKTTCNNFINLYKKFGEETGMYDDYALKEEFEEYSYSQLVELISVDESKLLDYSSNLTIKEIRTLKKIDKYKDYLLSEGKKILFDFLNNKNLLSRFLTSSLEISCSDLENYINSNSSSVNFNIPCEIELNSKIENARFNIRIDLNDDGIISKKFCCDYFKYFDFSDIPNFSFDSVDLNVHSIIEAMDLFNVYYDNFVEKINNSTDKNNHIKQQEEKTKKDDFLKTFKAYSINDLIKNKLDDTISPITKVFFELIINKEHDLSNQKNPFFMLNKTYLYYDNYCWYIRYKEIDIRVYSFQLELKKDKKRKIIDLCGFLKMLNNSNGVFYPNDLLLSFMDDIPMSDFENIEVEEIE